MQPGENLQEQATRMKNVRKIFHNKLLWSYLVGQRTVQVGHHIYRMGKYTYLVCKSFSMVMACIWGMAYVQCTYKALKHSQVNRLCGLPSFLSFTYLHVLLFILDRHEVLALKNVTLVFSEYQVYSN